MPVHTCVAKCAWNGGYICHWGASFSWGCTFGGVYVPCHETCLASWNVLYAVMMATLVEFMYPVIKPVWHRETYAVMMATLVEFMYPVIKPVWHRKTYCMLWWWRLWWSLCTLSLNLSGIVKRIVCCDDGDFFLACEEFGRRLESHSSTVPF